jgi:hypothetical protein
VADVPDKPGEEAEADDSADRDAGNERPTVSPPFDPIAFARDILRPTPQPMAAVRQGDAHTSATPDAGMANPRGMSERRTPLGVPAVPMPPKPRLTPPGRQARRKTPTSTLSLANARIPSNLPPRPGTAKLDGRVDAIPRDSARDPKSPEPAKLVESISSLHAVTREWADLEVATRPPPPNPAPSEKPPSEPNPEPPELSTRPPPADGPGVDPVVEILQDRTPQMDLDDVAPVGPPLSPPRDNAHAQQPSKAGSRTLRVEHIDNVADEHSVDTVRKPIPRGDVKTRSREMADRVSLGDYSGALEIAEKILADTPDDRAALACAENCRTVLRQMYATRIGPLDRVPVVMVPRDQLRWLSIDHRAGFVLSLVDGVSTLEMIIDVSGMAELDTLRILSELAQQRIISLR